MKKFVTLFLLCAACINQVNAKAYVGLGIGSAFANSKQKIELSSINEGATSYNQDAQKTALFSELIAGYEFIDTIHFSTELGLFFPQIKTKSKMNQNMALKYNVTRFGNGYSFAMRGGYYLNNTLIYIKAGIESRKISINFTDTHNTPNTRYPSLNKKYRNIAFVPGIGMETPLNAHIGFRLEGRYAISKRKSFDLTVSNRTYTKIKTKPCLYSLTAAIIYKF